MKPALVARFRGALPSECAEDVDVVAAMLGRGSHSPSEFDVGPIVMRGERLRIPTRLYFPEPTPEQLRELSERQRLVASCWFTRHHNGHVRERMVEEVLRHDAVWTAPYVIQLLGEYVIEIVRVLEAGIAAQHEQPYSEFLNENIPFWQLTRQRMISYWDCYYRSEFPDRARYPAARVFERLEAWRAKQATAPVLSLAVLVDQLRARYRVEALDAADDQTTLRFPEYPDAILGIRLQGQSRLRLTYPEVVAKPSGECHEVEVTSEGVLPEGLYWIAGQLARHGRVLPEFVRGPLPPLRRNKN